MKMSIEAGDGFVEIEGTPPFAACRVRRATNHQNIVAEFVVGAADCERIAAFFEAARRCLAVGAKDGSP